MVCPVTKDAASEQSHITASAISSGRPILPTGCRATIWASISGLLVRASSINGVRIYPGHTAFTRIPDLAYSSAAVFVNPTTPCLLALYTPDRLQEPTKPMMDAVLTMAPPPCVHIWIISYFMHNHTPFRLMLMTRSQLSYESSCRRTRCREPIPALLWAQSNCP